MSGREHFDRELTDLRRQLHDLGLLVLDAISRTLDALKRNDLTLAAQVAENDHLINVAQHRVEEHAILLIARQQPVARDLRVIITAISAGAELERIGDYAKAIARLLIGSQESPPLSTPDELLALAAAAQTMLTHAIESLTTGSVEQAQALAVEEAALDQRYHEVRQQLNASLAGHSHPARVADLLAVAHYVERIADRATNVAERVIYGASARIVDLNP